MGKIQMKASALLHASAAEVYATIADYRHGHPNILPKEHLYDLQVEEGGYGAGTIMRFKSRFFGVEQSFYQRVSEPEPGRVLVERDIDTVQDESSTFTVTPVGNGGQCRVEILTELNASPGIKGLIERLALRIALPPAYRKEFQLMEAFAQKQGKALVEAHRV